MPDTTDNLLSFAETSVTRPGLLPVGTIPIQSSVTTADLAYTIVTASVTLASNVAGQNPVSTGTVSFAQVFPDSYTVWTVLPVGGFYPLAAPDGGVLGRAVAITTPPNGYPAGYTYPANNLVCSVVPTAYTAAELASLPITRDAVDNRYYRTVSCTVHAGYAPPLYYNVAGWYANYEARTDQYGNGYNAWVAARHTAPIPNVAGNYSASVAEVWRSASPAEPLGIGSGSGFRGWIPLAPAPLVFTARNRYWYTNNFLLAVAEVDATGNPVPPTNPNPNPGNTTTPPVVKACQKCCQRKIKLTWTGVETAMLYNVLRDSQQIGNTTDQTFTDTGVSAGVTYTYTVLPVFANGTGTAGTAAIRVRGWKQPAKTTASYTKPDAPASDWQTPGCNAVGTTFP